MTIKKTRAVKPQHKKHIEPLTGDFPIVGIGASAGGLQAYEEFFSAMPTDCGVAIVLVTHLDPSQASILPELIQKKTGMKVFQAADNMKIAPNQVYVIRPNRGLALFKGSLQLFELGKPRGANLPIDSFFRSLASDWGSRAIGIVLSGTGTDGTLGIRAIKGEAGMVMVQDPETAKFDGMPRNAIASGMADYVLPPQRMPEKLYDYARARELLGASGQAEMLGTPVLDRIHRDSYSMWDRQIDMLTTQKKPVAATEEKWLRLDGAPVEMVISATPISFQKKQGALFFVREKLLNSRESNVVGKE